MHADIHLLLHRTSAAEDHRRAAAAGRAGSVRERVGRTLVAWGIRLSGPTDLTVALAA
ncbi:hypothetical protein [Streptomyces hydrogenans]|uniref:Uncharacterized protein n=1 Tax=Streptomyces hydrogenans TaxID=1873719 RepID=A0ABQ3P6V5_9ACTN|nr:hypothetical protein [Streptomyces hydrogenans]GHG02621.1 hypothetical protein GCM10018784_13120 [Streptomyces hydrogenans]GHI20757.1 hypothetical protein Shyd_21280 [Streptomyces hydrogenans]